MSSKFPAYVEECLNRLDRGEDLLEILNDFPGQQDRLKPLLLVAMASRAFPLPAPTHTAQRLGKNQLLEEMETMRLLGMFRKNPEIPPTTLLVASLVKAYRSRLAPSYRFAVLALVLGMSGGFLTLSASAASQPGDLLYNLKVGMERVQMVLPFHLLPSSSRSSLTPEASSAPPGGSGTVSHRADDRSIWDYKGFPLELGQQDIPGLAVAALAEEEQQKPPDLPSPQATPRKGHNKAGQVDASLDNLAEEIEDKNQTGKALGQVKSNPGKALGKDKPNQNKPNNKK